jgi:murein endopeptidase
MGNKALVIVVSFVQCFYTWQTDRFWLKEFNKWFKRAAHIHTDVSAFVVCYYVQDFKQAS